MTTDSVGIVSGDESDIHDEEVRERFGTSDE
jgi:hypothetical protein